MLYDTEQNRPCFQAKTPFWTWRAKTMPCWTVPPPWRQYLGTPPALLSFFPLSLYPLPSPHTSSPISPPPQDRAFLACRLDILCVKGDSVSPLSLPITANQSFVTHDYTHDTRFPWGLLTREEFIRLNHDATTNIAQISYMKREKLIYLLLILICRQIMQVVFGMLGWQCRTAEVKCRCQNRAGCLVPKQVRIWSKALANPQVEGVRAAG